MRTQKYVEGFDEMAKFAKSLKAGDTVRIRWKIWEAGPGMGDHRSKYEVVSVSKRGPVVSMTSPQLRAHGSRTPPSIVFKDRGAWLLRKGHDSKKVTGLGAGKAHSKKKRAKKAGKKTGSSRRSESARLNGALSLVDKP